VALDLGAGSLFIGGLHNALWASGLAVVGAAVASALVLKRGRSTRSTEPHTFAAP